MKDRTCYLIAKALSNEATGEELKELDEVQASNPEVGFYIEEISRWWKATEETCDEEPERVFQKHLQRMQDEGLFLSSPLKKL